MNFGQKLKLKKDWEYNDIVTFEKGDIFQVAEYQHKYRMKLYHPGISLVDFKFDWNDRDSKIEEYFEVIEDFSDRLAELEKVILDYFLAKGYVLKSGDWGFKVQIDTDFREKKIEIWFYENTFCEMIFSVRKITTKEMFDKAFEFFSLDKVQR